MTIYWIEDPHSKSLLPPHHNQKYDEVQTQCIRLSLEKIDAAWAKNTYCYIDRNKQSYGAISKEKFRSLEEGIKKGNEIPMPTIHTNTGNAADFRFSQGRHRTAIARDLGETHAMFTVRVDQAGIFLAEFS